METNWFETIKTKLQNYPEWVFDVGVFGLVGFVVGFVFKNFGKVLLFGAIGLIIGLGILHYAHIISVNMNQIKDILGLAAANTIDDGVRIYSDWARLHIVGLLAAAVSFCIGWKVG